MSDLGNKEIFSKNLKYYMDLNFKDRNTVCKDLNIPYTTFAEWYNGNIYPRIDKIEMLADYFGILKSDLIEDKTLPEDTPEIRAIARDVAKLKPEKKELFKNLLKQMSDEANEVSKK